MKTLFLFLYVFHQPDTLPPPPTLFASLDSFYIQKTAADLTEFAETTKGDWMAWLPSVGLAYTPAGDPRPGVNYSLATVFSNIKSKQGQKQKRESIIQRNQLLYEADHRSLTAALTELAQLKADYQFALQIHAIDSTLYEVEQRKADNAEIAPTDFLKEQRAYLLKEQDLRRKWREIESKELLIVTLSRHNSKIYLDLTLQAITDKTSPMEDTKGIKDKQK